MELLGTGNAAGFPVYGCQCQYCQTALIRGNKRTQCSALVSQNQQNLLIDAGQMDLHTRFAPGSLSAILLTHFHPDHVQGLFHYRWGKNLVVPVYCPYDPDGCADLYKYPGILEFKFIPAFERFHIGDIVIRTIPLEHSKPTLGYVIQSGKQTIAYLTDTKGLSYEAVRALAETSVDLLVIDCSFMPGIDRPGHNNLDDVYLIDRQIKPGRIILTHIGHDFHIWLQHNSHTLPAHVSVAEDGMLLT